MAHVRLCMWPSLTMTMLVPTKKTAAWQHTRAPVHQTTRRTCRTDTSTCTPRYLLPDPIQVCTTTGHHTTPEGCQQACHVIKCPSQPHSNPCTLAKNEPEKTQNEKPPFIHCSSHPMTRVLPLCPQKPARTWVTPHGNVHGSRPQMSAWMHANQVPGSEH